MFGAIKEMFQLSSAAIVVQNLLERQRSTGLFDVDPKALSHRLVAQVVSQDRDMFNGKKGPKPHRISVAALALAQGMRNLDRHSDDYAACFLSTGMILLDMEENGGNYPLTNKDAAFLELARREYMKYEPMDGLEEVIRQTDQSDCVPDRSPPCSDLELNQRRMALRARLAAYERR